ncbi:uncharacterized protein LOC116292070 [Actinia tenebrosa]|uniref:Uncharacterized protein LOC116292070 n=1 Tax=Actinia tenebrosa TaxID=6105 RepID=A0A6P8HJV7_ACTTE|nr:uncharacterized protein LOC116292070 [Actinia tenebrosa]XP_031555170.1 uncharacterized protein LOC116292070 [Actinia tenebrosa]
MRDQSSKKSKQKVIYDSIDGNFDMVMKADEKDQNENEKTEIDITKVATEILKHNDTDAILKALSDNDTDKLDTYTDGDASNAKNLETQKKPHYYFLTSNHSKVSNNSALEKGQDNHHATEKNEKHQEHGIHGNQTAGNHSKADASSLYEHAKQALSNDTGKNRNDSSNIKVNTHEDKEADKGASSGANDKKNKDGEPLDHSKEESKQDTTMDQDEVDSTIKKQGENLEINNFSSDQESLNYNRQKNKAVTSIDWGNLHALNALVEILAEHETNGTQNNTNTNQPQNDTTPTKGNAAVIEKKAKNGEVNTITQGAQPNKTKETSHPTHDNENAPFARKDGTTMNMNGDDYTKHDGGKRQNVTGEGNARSKANLTMPENPNGGQTAPKMIDTSKNRKDTSADTTQGKMKKKKNATTEQEFLFNLLKDVVLSLHDTNDSTITTKLGDELDKVINTTTKMNSENNDKKFTSWTAWTTCSKSCGEGTKTRMRKCRLDKKDCKGPLHQAESCHGYNCTVDGGFTEWSVWSSACSAKCGEGVFKIRSRTCTNPAAQFGGKPCEGALTEQQDCKLKPCVGFEIAGKIGSQTIVPKIETQQAVKEKGLWSPWSAWSTCTATCGGEGYSSRERSCLPGKQCAGPRYDTKQCGTEPCPVEGGYTPWTAWSPCTPSCGLRAYRMRTRNCTNPPPSHGGRKCYDSALETEPCMIVHCPIDGGYSSWSSWSPCTKTCGSSSLSQRERACTSPEPRYGGRPCQGDSVQTRECGKQPCPVNGDFSDWSSWTPCANVSCGSNLFSMRNRTCDNPRPKFGGENCTGHLVEKKSCRLKHCPINGGFSSWSQWSECPKNCKVSGVAHRRRRCDNPKPRNGGQDCVGPKLETKACSNTCPVDGGFTEWTSWSKCSQECGRTSIKSRERYCTNPSPANGGKRCKGSKFQVKICRKDGCPVNGNYTAWSDWTVCPKCGFGVQTRQRTCTNPSPINGGKDCEGPAKETLACPFKRCRNNGFGQWSSYGHCSKSCGGGAKMRRRTCEDESKGCDGKFVQLKPCNQHSCVLGNDHLIDVNPVSLCGFNPCKISRCLGYPQAKCLTSSGCWPVFFDKRGNILESCKGDKTVFTSSPEMICHSDPCKVSECYTDEVASCHVSIRCKPVFLDSGGNKLDCRGLLKVPPITLCGADPCEGSSCDLDKNARCVADYNCNLVFISTENEILSKCKVSKYRDNDYIINSKAGKRR